MENIIFRPCYRRRCGMDRESCGALGKIGYRSRLSWPSYWYTDRASVIDDLFAQGIDEIYMDARDVTAKIVCRMGGQIVGEPQPFYVGTVTPVVLRKENYHY